MTDVVKPEGVESSAPGAAAPASMEIAIREVRIDLIIEMTFIYIHCHDAELHRIFHLLLYAAPQCACRIACPEHEQAIFLQSDGAKVTFRVKPSTKIEKVSH